MDSTHTDLKVVLVGHMYTGKTCLFNRICLGTYTDNTSATVCFSGVKQIPVQIAEQDAPIQMCLWDTIGQDRFTAPTRQFTRNASAALICCSLNNTDFDLEKAKFWTHIFLQDSPDCKLYLVGTKCDLPRVESNVAMLKEYAERYNASYIETSSKDNINVTEMIQKVARDWAVDVDGRVNGRSGGGLFKMGELNLEDAPPKRPSRKCPCTIS